MMVMQMVISDSYDAVVFVFVFVFVFVYSVWLGWIE